MEEAGDAFLPGGRQDHVYRVVHRHDAQQRARVVHHRQRQQIVIGDGVRYLALVIQRVRHLGHGMRDIDDARAGVGQQHVAQRYLAL